MKKFLCSFLALVIAISAASSCFAASKFDTDIIYVGTDSKTDPVNLRTSKDGYEYVKGFGDFPEDTAFLTGYNGKDFDGTLPSTVDGLDVVGIANFAETDSYFCYVPFFRNDTSVDSVVIPKNVKDFIEVPFDIGDYEKIEKFFCGYGWFPIYKDVRNITVEAGSEAFTVEGKALYSKDKKVLYKYFGTDKTFTVPNGVEKIASFAFAYTKLQKVVLPKDLTYIDEAAFYKSELKEIDIPSKVERILVETFAYCKNLQKVVFAKSSKDKFISENAFYKCTALESISLPCNVFSKNSFRGCTSLKKYVTTGSIAPEGTVFGKCAVYLNGNERITKPGKSKGIYPVFPESGSVRLSWFYAQYATGYRIYMKGPNDKSYKKVTDIKGITNCEYTVKNLKANKTYMFKIRPFKEIGKKRVYGSYITKAFSASKKKTYVTAKTPLKTPKATIKGGKGKITVKCSDMPLATNITIKYRQLPKSGESAGSYKYKYVRLSAKNAAKNTVIKLKKGNYEICVKSIIKNKSGKKTNESYYTNLKTVKVK